MPLLVLTALWWARELKGRGPSRGTSFVVAAWSLTTVVLVSLQLFGFQVHPHSIIRPNEIHELPTRWMPDPQSVTRPAYGFEGFYPRFSDSLATLLFFRKRDYSDSIVYSSPSACTARFARTYWPTWTVKLDGRSIEPHSDSEGRLTCAADSGQHQLVATIEESASERVGNWISSISFAGLVIASAFAQAHRTRKYSLKSSHGSV